MDKLCFAEEAMNYKEWLKVTRVDVVPIIVCAWQGDIEALSIVNTDFRGMTVARYAARIGYLYSIAVIPEARRTGLGERMVQKELACLKELGCVLVQAHTRTENEASQKMLAKCGFSPIQYVTDFYDDMEDAILWSRIL